MPKSTGTSTILPRFVSLINSFLLGLILGYVLIFSFFVYFYCQWVRMEFYDLFRCEERKRKDLLHAEFSISGPSYRVFGILSLFPFFMLGWGRGFWVLGLGLNFEGRINGELLC